MGTIETILGGFVGGGASNRSHKWHLQAVMNTEPKKQRDQYEPIYFIEEDFGDIDREHDDPMVILMLVHNFLIKRILVHKESSTNILYSHAVEALGLKRNIYIYIYI